MRFVDTHNFMKYFYSAVFTSSEDGNKYYARIPDLPGCITTGESLQDAIEQITDAASGWLVAAEGEELAVPPNATPQNFFERDDKAVLSMIQVDTVAYRSLTDNHAVRENVSLPVWMKDLAYKRDINCSQVLQEGLKDWFNVI